MNVELFTSIIVPGLTAVFSVMLTVWLYQKRDKLNALRAIKSEVEQNHETAKSIQKHVSGDMILRQEDKERPPSLSPFSTHTFQNAKNAGVLAKLPEEVRDAVSEHYTLLEFTNNQLQYRQQIRSTSRALSGFSDLMNSIDLVILLKLHSLGVADLSELQLEENLREVDNTDDETITFDNVAETIDEELEEHPILDWLL